MLFFVLVLVALLILCFGWGAVKKIEVNSLKKFLQQRDDNLKLDSNAPSMRLFCSNLCAFLDFI